MSMAMKVVRKLFINLRKMFCCFLGFESQYSQNM
jgi:hypothetical protein